jgi:hypothetical protein
VKIQDAYKQKMAAELKEWDAQINLLEAKMENAGADLRLKSTDEFKSLRAKQLAASEKMKELAKDSGEAWEQVKETADKMWDDIKLGIAELRVKLH